MTTSPPRWSAPPCASPPLRSSSSSSPAWREHAAFARSSQSSPFAMPSCSWLRPLALATVVALGGCAALPSQVERRESHAIVDAAATSLGRVAAASVSADGAGLSGFRLLPGGDDALEARLTLI